MPAVSKKQRMVMAIAEHHPEELKGKNRGLLKMSHKQLHDFASTPEKGLPERKGHSTKELKQYVKRRSKT